MRSKLPKAEGATVTGWPAIAVAHTMGHGVLEASHRTDPVAREGQDEKTDPCRTPSGARARVDRSAVSDHGVGHGDPVAFGPMRPVTLPVPPPHLTVQGQSAHVWYSEGGSHLVQ